MQPDRNHVGQRGWRYELWDVIHPRQAANVIPQEDSSQGNLQLRMVDFTPITLIATSHHYRGPFGWLTKTWHDYKRGRQMRQLEEGEWKDAFMFVAGSGDDEENPNWRSKWAMEIKDEKNFDWGKRMEPDECRWL
ncbi:hypothetical protein SCUP515_12770 [Seiridium cupressi]